MEKNISLVYLVAGISSRFGGKPKFFAKIGKNNESLIEISLNQALPAGFTKIVFIVSDQTEKLFKEKFGLEYLSIPISYAHQEFNKELRDKPWGTTAALCSIKGVVDCPFVICNGDDLYGKIAFKKLVEHLLDEKNKGSCATIGYQLKEVLPEKGKVNRGIFHLDKEEYVLDIVETFDIEKNTLTEKGLESDANCSMNIFGLYPNVVEDLDEILKKFKESHKGDRTIECLLPVELSRLIKEGKMKMKLYETSEKCYGLTNPEDEEVLRETLGKL